TAPASVRIDTSPAGIVARLEMYDATTHRLTGGPRPVGRTPLDLSLDPGSYRLTFEETATHVGFHYPVLLAAGERYEASIPVPARAAVPKEFVYVPEGRFFFGAQNEELRTDFLGTIPLRAMNANAFFIAKHETTVGEWIAFLNTLSAKDQEARRPHGHFPGAVGSVDVSFSVKHDWQITFRATDISYQARTGEPFRYLDR